ncbi:hypothetical protein FLK61_34685 [Paenalkalicoccus suaedae]|uniref:Uncharacterized protein n=2 Tax=Paenalkalicoccus suaedae TaxID=2592382 RepID=A0A859FG72_9BACI|nr:hypothetical protein FLK61_34685 [Paenalkalicoccus suaedae]
MKRLIFWIGLSIFIGWSISILVNYPVYVQQTNYTLINSMVEGILFMAVMLGIYFFIIRTVEKKPNLASIQLLVGGVASLILAVVLL